MNALWSRSVGLRELGVMRPVEAMIVDASMCCLKTLTSRGQS